MDINKLIEVMKSEFPDKAIDIEEALELLKETISEAVEIINSKTYANLKNRDYDTVTKYTNISKEVSYYEAKIDDLINKLDIVDDKQINGGITEQTKQSINENYLVDNKIEHTLYEDFTHIRPFGFKINDNDIIEAKSWQEVLVKTCEYFLKVDSNKFLGLEGKPSMNGKKHKYFSEDKTGLRLPKSVSGKIFVETNMSGNSIRNLIVKLLKEFGYKINEYKVFFRADYTANNKIDHNESEVNDIL